MVFRSDESVSARISARVSVDSLASLPPMFPQKVEYLAGSP